MHPRAPTATPPDLDPWRDLATHPRLAVLCDLDGTLVPFAATPAQATLDPEVPAILAALARGGVQVVIVSGRPRPALEPLAEIIPDAWWVAEHGAWWRSGDRWEGPPAPTPELDDLEATLRALAQVPGVRYERKSLSVCIHWRLVAPADRAALIASAELACEEWLEAHADYEQLLGVDMMEVRPRHIHKGAAVRRVRARIDGVRMLALGDDVTDEDMFAELGIEDRAIAVGEPRAQTAAHASLTGPAAVHGFLRWIAEVRAGAAVAVPPLAPVVQPRATGERRSLLVMSNRMPSAVNGRRREVGGLVAALEPALRGREAIWLGWSGHEREGTSRVVVDAVGEPARASFDLPQQLRDKFYAGFCNRSLWPLFHTFPGRVRYEDAEWAAYVDANEMYARHAVELVRPDGMIWVHDYHLLLAARALRTLGHRGPIGLFLHVPFPARDLFDTIPWRAQLLDALLDFDLIGVHTARDAENLRGLAAALPDAVIERGTIRRGRQACAVDVFPIAIDPTPFLGIGDESAEIASLRESLFGRRLLLGIDRLDYSKGIPERLAAFERLLELWPEWRSRVSLVQVSVPSRAEIPEYAELKHRVETMVGRINGRFGEADWTPVRYLYRSYEPALLAQLYRLADVALVTPLRDGMNLVAKEFVVAQDPEQPGVLVLSEFAGAAAELVDAVLTNPYHVDGVAADLDRALRMPTAERIDRHARLVAALRRGGTATTWATRFLERLAPAAQAAQSPGARPRSGATLVS